MTEHAPAMLVAVLALVRTPGVFADCQTPDLGAAATILASDAAGGGEVGFAVDVDGSIAIASARASDAAGHRAGAAYLFDVSAPDHPSEIARLVPTELTPELEFGFDVAIGGGLALVGAWRDPTHGEDAGAVYIFDAAAGDRLAKITPDFPSAGEAFGFSVATEGAVAIIGAIGHSESADDAGAAYLFDLAEPEQPVQLAKITPTDPGLGAWFGWAVALRNGVAVVGAQRDSEAAPSAGAAYLFDVSNPRSPSLIGKLLPPDLEPYDTFGAAVAINGVVALIGAPDSREGGDASGAVYAYDATTGDPLAKFIPRDPEPGDAFGQSIDLDSDTAIIGCDEKVYLFDVSDPAIPVERLKLVPVTHDPPNFGFSVAISHGVAIVGQSEPTSPDAGAAFAFDLGAALPPPCATPLCPGDIDHNRNTDLGDFARLMSAFGTKPTDPFFAYDPGADFDDDGDIDVFDFGVIAGNFGCHD